MVAHALRVVHDPEVEGITGRCAAAAVAAADPVSPPLGYYPHTGTLSVYRHGFRQKPAARPVSVCPVSGLPIYGSRPAPKGRGKRGQITGFSSEAALRLRSWLLTHYVEGGQLWDVTLTIPGDVTPEEWDRLKRRIFKRWERAGFGVVWRVELQRRGTPHLHCVVWTPAAMPMEKRNQLLYVAWWECLPEEKRFSAGAWKHAAHVKGPYTDIEQSPRWLAYVAAHASKRKKEQLGWQGKQWGIINRTQFVERKPMVEVSMTFEEEKRFKRLLSRYLHSKSREYRAKLMKRGIKPKRRLRRMFFPAGCKSTRLMSPELVCRMVEAVKRTAVNETEGARIGVATTQSRVRTSSSERTHRKGRLSNGRPAPASKRADRKRTRGQGEGAVTAVSSDE